jgi:hypothetical protein
MNENGSPLMRKYLALFAAWYLGVLVAGAAIIRLLSISSGSVVNTVALFAGAMFASQSFARSHRRTFERAEYKTLLLGSVSVDATLQLALSISLATKVSSAAQSFAVLSSIAFVVLVHAAILAFVYSDRMVRSYVPKT